MRKTLLIAAEAVSLIATALESSLADEWEVAVTANEDEAVGLLRDHADALVVFTDNRRRWGLELTAPSRRIERPPERTILLVHNRTSDRPLQVMVNADLIINVTRGKPEDPLAVIVAALNCWFPRSNGTGKKSRKKD